MRAHQGVLTSVGLAMLLGACGGAPPSAPPKPPTAQPVAAAPATVIIKPIPAVAA